MTAGRGRTWRALPVLLAALLLVMPLWRAGGESETPTKPSETVEPTADGMTTLFLNSHEREIVQPGETLRYRFTPSSSAEYLFRSFPIDEAGHPATSVRLIRASDGVQVASSEQEGCIRLESGLQADETYWLEIDAAEAGGMAVEVMLDARGRCFDDPISLPGESIRYAKTIVRPRDVHWFSFVAPIDGWYSIRTEKAGDELLDTRGQLLDASGRTIAANDDILFPGDANFMIQHELKAGETYYVRISAFSNETGAYRLVLIVPEEGKETPDGVTLSRHDLLLDVDEAFRLSAEVAPRDALSEVVYASSDGSVVTVEPDGTVRAVAAGEAQVWAFSYGEARDCCTVTVRPVEVTYMAVEEDQLTLRVDEQLTISPVFEPENASDRTARYESSDEAVVTVSPYGVLTGVSAGDAVITVTSSDGGFVDTVRVHVDGVRPVYRALVLCEHDYEDGVRLGGLNTAQGVADMLAGQSIDGAGYQVQLQTDSSRADVLRGIREAFDGAVETDVSLLYINCHGAYENGVAYLRLHDETRITARQLEAMLRDVPGKVIILLDFCQSGAFIGAGGTFERFSADMREAFSGGSPLTSGRYTVIASASADEDSYRRSFTGASSEESTAAIMGRSLCEGAGWDLIYDRSVSLKADANRDKRITVQEIYEYTRKRVMHYLDGSGARQTVHVYPAGDQTVIFGRTE